MRPGRAADHSPPSSAVVMEEYSYISTHPLGHTGPVTGTLYLFIYTYIYIRKIYFQNVLLYQGSQYSKFAGSSLTALKQQLSLLFEFT